MSIIGPCVYASTIEPIWESDEAKILYQFLFYLRLILFGGCCNPFIFLIRLDLYHIHHDVIYRVEMCVCPFWIRPIYHVVHYCTRFSFFFFFFFFTIFYFLSVWVWLLELIRYSESVFFFFRLCASSAELVVEKKPFFTLLWLLLSIPFWPALVSEKGASQSGENGRADDDWTWPVGESSLRIENKKMKSIVLCQFLRRETRRKRPEITLGSLGHRTTHTHRSCRLYILTAGNRRRPES
jgi:glycosyltransferase involved in cell wall biosynthesis